MGDEEVETTNINSTLGNSHCMHLKLGKPPEMADNWMETEDQRDNFKKIIVISNISQCFTASRNNELNPLRFGAFPYSVSHFCLSTMCYH